MSPVFNVFNPDTRRLCLRSVALAPLAYRSRVAMEEAAALDAAVGELEVAKLRGQKIH